jgi:hypothetical protein
MNKLFMALLFLTFLGAGVLFYLMRTYPVDNIPLGEVAKDKAESTEKKDSHSADPKSESENKDHSGHLTTAVDSHADTATSAHDKSAHETAGTNAKEAHSEPQIADSKGYSATQTLAIQTTPVSAMVFVEGEMKGQTPVEIQLTDKPQQIKLEAVGFNEVVREAPAKKTGHHATAENFKWNVTLRAKKGALAESPRAKTQHPPNNEIILHGKKGPAWIQIKSFSVGEAAISKDFIEKVRAKWGPKVFACDVALPEKGTWTRVLVGPYANKAQAKQDSIKLGAELNETPFVTGPQTCL